MKWIEAVADGEKLLRVPEEDIVFSPAAESDLPEIQALLIAAFRASPGAPFADVELLRWKYFEPRPGFLGPRSYVLKRDDRIIAHCGLAPVRFISPLRDVAGVCFMDWAARRDAPGAGSALMRRLMRTNRVSLVTWGTGPSRAALAKLEFAPCGRLEHFLRIVRPWRQFFMRPPSEPAWRACARLARNFLWSLPPLPSVPEEWSAEAVSAFGPGTWYNRPTNRLMLTWRDRELLNYWLRCPQGTFSGFLLLHRRQPCGHFLLSRTGNKAHIADVRVDVEKPNAWRAAYALAIRTAAESADVHEIVAAASTPAARQALWRGGFHTRGQGLFGLYAPSGAMSSHPPIYWNPIDDDSALF